MALPHSEPSPLAELFSLPQSLGSQLSILSSPLMAPNPPDEKPRAGSEPEREPRRQNRPVIHPSFIQVTKAYMFEDTFQDCHEAMGVDRSRDEQLRLLGVSWIDSVRRVLHLPVRTFNTAAVYYHKFRLVHPPNDYNYVDAAAAALFIACKIEDTLKKSREIVCAAYNLKLPASEHLTPDDPVFDASARSVIGLERLMLEAFSFDFRTRHPQEILVQAAKKHGFAKDMDIYHLAYRISIDLYRTFAPLKQVPSTLAFSCLELSCRLMGHHCESLENGEHYELFRTKRAPIMETLLDMLELYTHNRTSTLIGRDFPEDRFLQIRIPLNQEAKDKDLPRYLTPWDVLGLEKPEYLRNKPPVKPSNARGRQTENAPRPLHPLTPVAANGDRRGESEKGRDAPLRFILDPAYAAEEGRLVSEFFKVETEEYEVEE